MTQVSLNEAEWQSNLPDLIAAYVDRWELTLGTPYGGGSVSYVAEATLADGTETVFKLSIPHREAVGEAEALRWWDGNGAIRLLEHDPDDYALLLERVDPGTKLTEHHELSAETRLRVAAELLADLWRRGVPEQSSFERVDDVAAEWAELAGRRMEQLAPPYDPGLVARGIELLRTLPASAERQVVVHGDYNPGNILAAARAPWLVIDPKPMIGDPGYDLCPLLLQVDDPFAHPDPAAILSDRVDLVANAIDLPSERILAWCLARCVESALWYAARSEVDNGTNEMTMAATIAALIDRA